LILIDQGDIYGISMAVDGMIAAADAGDLTFTWSV
jgi:hypothetical protein